MKKNDKDIRASTSVCVKFFPFCTFKTYFFYFIHLFLQNININLSIIHIYLNKIFIYLTLWTVTVTVRWEKKWEKESEVKRGEKKKRIKKSFIWWIVTVYIYTVTVYLQDHCAYLDIFTKTDMGGFWVKICKIDYFLYFRRLSTSWCGCSL